MHGLAKSVCCACDPNARLDVPSIGFICVCVCLKVITSFRNLYLCEFAYYVVG